MHLTVSSATLQSFSTSANALMDYFRGPQHALASFLHTIPPNYSPTPTRILSCYHFNAELKSRSSVYLFDCGDNLSVHLAPLHRMDHSCVSSCGERPIVRESIMIRDHSGHGLGQWEEALHSNASSHWLSTCPEWSLMIIMMRAANPHAWRCWAICILKMGQYM